MQRREFLRRSSVAALSLPCVARALEAAETSPMLASLDKACIVLWMTGGSPTPYLWDVKPNTRQRLKSIETEIPGVRISEHFPKTALVMRHLSLIRSMSTREHDTARANYFMRTSHITNPVVQHPAFGSIVSHELSPKRTGLKLPGFIALGGEPAGPGFLGNGHAAYVVRTDDATKIAELKATEEQFQRRLQFLEAIQDAAPQEDRGNVPVEYRQVQAKAASILSSQQMRAFDLSDEPQSSLDLYGDNVFGRGLLKARRLVEQAVPFVEVHFPYRWGSQHEAGPRVTLPQMAASHFPTLDAGLSGLVTDLERRGMIDDVTIVCIGPHSFTLKSLDANVKPDNWASAWSSVVGGGGLKNGQVIGSTNDQGDRVTSPKSYLPGDIWATVAHALGISHTTRYTSPKGRPLNIVNGGIPIAELV